MEDLAHTHGQEGHGHTVVGDALGHFEIPHLHAVANDVGDQCDNGNEDALIGDVPAQTTGENAVIRGTGRPLHHVRLLPLQTQRQRREAVGDEVDEQQMHRVHQGKAQQRSHEHAQHLAHIGGQQELNGLADIVVDTAALAYGAHDGGKVVVGQHHIRHILGNVGAGDAHAHADVGGFDRRGVVDAVAGHSRHSPPLAPCVNDADLMLRLHTGVHAVLLHLLGQLLVAEAVQSAAGNGLRGIVQYPQLLGDGHGGILVVAGDHHWPDACRAALLDGGLHLRTHRVDHTRQTHEAQILLQILRAVVLGQAALPQADGRRQHTQGLIRHGLVLRQNFLTLLLGHGQHLAALLISGAAAQHLIRCALGVLNEAVIHAVDGGHHLPGGVEGSLRRTGLLLLQPVLIQPAVHAEAHQRRLRGLALHRAIGILHGVVAEGHSGTQQSLRAGVLHHRHFILCEGAGLIGADDLRAAQRLHRRQTADHSVVLAHLGDADGEHHRYHRGKTLRNGGHRQRHRHHEGLQHALQRQGTRHQQVKYKDEHANGQHHLGQGVAQLGQLTLQGRLLLLRLGQHTGDLAHLRVHARGGDHHAAPAVYHRRAHVGHVLPVAQRHLFPGEGLRKLADGDALAGEGCLLDLHGGAL